MILFEKKWGNYKDFFDRDRIYEWCFVEKFLLPEHESYPLDHGLDTIEEELSHWIKSTQSNHEKSQKHIHENFTESLSVKSLLCSCTECAVNFRDLLTDHLIRSLGERIEQASEEFKDLTIEQEMRDFVDAYNRLSRFINRKLSKAKFKLRRSQYNKLKAEVNSLIKNAFGYDSNALVVYRQKLDDLIIEELRLKGLRRDLVEKDQKYRFFLQQGEGIWKENQSLKKEIQRLIQSVLSLKRKDISAKILQDYLGQFWSHSEARRMPRRIIYHRGPTNSGKTYHAIQRLAQVENGCYLAPLRLLATELYDTLNEMEVKTTLLTGEEVIEVEDATHFSSTIEMVKLQELFDMCVIDEIQMINDPQRGWAWTRALVGVQAPEIHLCGDSTAFKLVEEICRLCGDNLEVKEYERMTELKVIPSKIKADELQKHDAVIVFSRRNALRYKIDLERLDYKVSIIYGRLSPEVRREQARKFDEGETDIIVSTDAISMGMNLPIKRVIFTTLSKFIDSKEIFITNSEIKQISGRAGRYKRFPTGYVSVLERVDEGIEKIQDAMAEELPQKEFAMVGPDLDIFAKVNAALQSSSLPELGLSEFLRLFNTMQFDYPFYCVDLKEMIEIAEIVEQANMKVNSLLDSEIFGFSCAPVNLGLPGHLQYFISIVNRYVHGISISYDKIDYKSEDIDYLETSIKCVELYQWLARHFKDKNFDYDSIDLLYNKRLAIDKLNSLLSERITLGCTVCGCKLPSQHQHSICESCFKKRRFRRRRPRNSVKKEAAPSGGFKKKENNRGRGGNRRR